MSTDPDLLQPRILEFLAGEFARVEHQSVVKVQLLYTPLGGYSPDSIGVWTPDDGRSQELFADRAHAFIERLSGELVERARAHADTFGQGKHRFTIRCYQHLGGRQNHSFVLSPEYHGGDEQALVGQQLADPNATNVLGQLMRHLENRDRAVEKMLGTFLGAMTSNVGVLRAENESLRMQNQAFMSERVEWMGKIEEANSKEHDRQIESAVIVGENERKNLAVKKTFAMLPVVASAAISHLNKKTGKHGAGGDADAEIEREPTPLAALAKRLYQSLKTKQRDFIEDTLGMEQRILLAEAMRSAMEGGSPLLPMLIRELGETLQKDQMAAIMACLEDEQPMMFVQLLQAATAKADAGGPPAASQIEAGNSGAGDANAAPVRDS